VDFTNLVGFTSVVENTFGGGGFPGVNVCHNTDVTVLGELNLAIFGGGGGFEVNVLGYGDFVEDD
jgi:hypothetical protein